MTKEKIKFDTNWPERLAGYPQTEEFKEYFPHLREKLEQQAPDDKPDNQKMFLFVGIPGAGKSTVAEMIADNYPSLIIRTDWIFFEQLKDIIEDDYYKAYVYRRELADHFLEQGYSIILDSNIRKRADRKRNYQLAEKNDAQPVVVNLECPVEVAAQRQVLKGGVKRTYEEKMARLSQVAEQLEPVNQAERSRVKVVDLNTDQPQERIRKRLKKMFN
jgi:predicted kinase